MTRPLPLWRSLLFVPAIGDKYIAKAASVGADAIQIDLEDSVPPERKVEARSRVQAIAEEVSARGADIVVRINRPWRMAVADMEAAVGPRVRALSLPKVPGPGHIHAIAEVLDELEAERGLPPGHTGLIAMVETAEGLTRMNEIAAAHPRVLGLIVGSEDLALSLGMRPEADGLYVPAVMSVAAARAAGVLPLGFIGSIADYADKEAFRTIIRRARALGFVGGFAIHPNQVAVMNEEFAPSAAEVAGARALVAAFEAARAKGLGAVVHEGRMIDAPVVERARAVLATAARISGVPPA